MKNCGKLVQTFKEVRLSSWLDTAAWGDNLRSFRQPQPPTIHPVITKTTNTHHSPPYLKQQPHLQYLNLPSPTHRLCSNTSSTTLPPPHQTLDIHQTNPSHGVLCASSNSRRGGVLTGGGRSRECVHRGRAQPTKRVTPDRS